MRKSRSLSGAVALSLGMLYGCTSPTFPDLNVTGSIQGPTTVRVGDVVVYTGSLSFSNGTTSGTGEWSSSDTAVATIRNLPTSGPSSSTLPASGELSARAAGTAVISFKALAFGKGTSTPGTLTVRVE